MILRGDACGDVVGADVYARPGVDCGELPGMIMVPAWAGSSETKSTACTTRSPGTMSTKRASTMSESAVALPRAVEASAYVSTSRYDPPGPASNCSNLPLIPSGGSQAVSASRSTRAAKRGPAARRSRGRFRACHGPIVRPDTGDLDRLGTGARPRVATHAPHAPSGTCGGTRFRPSRRRVVARCLRCRRARVAVGGFGG